MVWGMVLGKQVSTVACQATRKLKSSLNYSYARVQASYKKKLATLPFRGLGSLRF